MAGCVRKKSRATRLWYICQMDYTDYLIVKFLVLVGIAVVVNFVYSFSTGKLLWQEQPDKSEAERLDS